MTAALFAWTLRFDNEGPTDLKNGCLEATLLHTRLLIEFLAGRPSEAGRTRYEGDIEPHDFVHDWKETVALDGYLDLVDRYLAHVSLERIRPASSRAWRLSE